jgi:predicted PurR-regulated permease PerM
MVPLGASDLMPSARPARLALIALTALRLPEETFQDLFSFRMELSTSQAAPVFSYPGVVPSRKAVSAFAQKCSGFWRMSSLKRGKIGASFMTDILSKRQDIEIPRVSEEQAIKSISPRSAWMIFLGIGVFLWLVRRILLPFVIAGAVAFVCYPAVDWLAAKQSVRRWVAAVEVFLFLLAIAVLVGLIAWPIFMHDFAPMIRNLQGNIEETARRFIGDGTVNVLGQPMNAEEFSQNAVAALRNWLGQNGEIFSLAGTGFVVAFGFILQFVLLAYFLISAPSIKAGLLWLIPPNQRQYSGSVWKALEPLLRRYLIGIAVVVTFAAIAAYIGLGLALNVQHAVLLALMTGFLETIPVVGPAASATIAGLAAIKSGNSIGGIIGYAIYAVALRLSIDQVVSPLILGRAARVNPVLIIFCFLAGGVLFGITGVILAVPLALGVKVILATVYADPLIGEDNKHEV